MEYDELYFEIDSNSLNAILVRPEIKPKATILFYHGAGGNIATYTDIYEGNHLESAIKYPGLLIEKIESLLN